ncbi:MAG: multicopper oxidase domain-containing protein [Pseudomonadales bacterium]|nr:multicopper oxidase domain-containing protein [Nitrospira sp.]MCB1650278.1 multicopper oxidase domain-containing protein [Pseudomonadales bacterium]MCP5331661.1 multicopper oxidase domain-containing protein [Pseudomonadales bacterium]MCP5343311.1 multicopper oxidase domain-containing protein [Pseudomonadales bacterium]
MNKHLLSTAILIASSALPLWASAETVKVEMTAKEVDIAIDNAGTTHRMWTYDGAIPGPVVRVKQGDLVQFTLHNHPDNGNSHSMDFHAAQVDVLEEFAETNPGDSKSYEFQANYPGVFVYHCGAESMAEHISRGMYGVIIVDPAEGYSADYPKPDREYLLVQGDLFQEGTSAEDITQGINWEASLINGKIFHYDPVHDPNASLTLEAMPGERVRIFFVNASINDAAALHPIAGIWDRVWDNGNPKNISYGVQTVDIAPAHGMVLDLVPPADRASNNAIVDHRMKHALSGAITVLMTHEDADPEKGRNGLLILR